MRMEDLDSARSSQQFADAALFDLEWLGLDWDGPVLYQSTRRAAYEAAIERLFAGGAAYPCVCSRGDIRQALGAPHGTSGEVAYPGTCRDRFRSLSHAEATSGRPPGVRLRVASKMIHFSDGIAGPQCFDVAREAGDFLVGRRGGSAGYQLAVVVDDAAQDVTEVFRGNDLLSSTARQILLLDALGLPHPQWYHAPLVTDRMGERLAKRVDSLSLRALREAGVPARAVLGWIARSAGMPGEVAHSVDLVDRFTLRNLPQAAVTAPRLTTLLG